MKHAKMIAMEEENVIRENVIVMRDLLGKIANLECVLLIAQAMENVIKEYVYAIQVLQENFVKKLK